MKYDILIIGAGPGGVSAGIYAKRAGRNVAIIEKFAVGGQLNMIGKIENYAGFKSIEGAELASEFESHLKSLDIPVIYDEVVDVDFSCEVKKIKTRNGNYEAIAVILALGSNSRELNIEGEKKIKGSGVSYCAVCDGRFFKGKKVAVVGSGDSAASDALYLSNLCSHVYVLTKSTLKMNNYTFLELEEKENISIIQGAISKKIEGDFNIKSLIYEKDGKEEKLDIDGVFVAIGKMPDTAMLKNKLKLSEKGYILSDNKMQTSEEGVYICGDIKEGSIKQISTAVGDGAIAGTEASKYVLRKQFSAKLFNV